MTKEKDESGRSCWVPTRIVLDQLSISRVTLRRLMEATRIEDRIWLDITLGGRRPEYRWRLDRVDVWFLEVTHPAHGGKTRGFGISASTVAAGTRRVRSPRRIVADREDALAVPKTFRPKTS